MEVTKAAPSFFYYAMIDGTRAVDSVAFGKDLDARAGKTGWRNLLDLLAPDSSDPSRLVDPSHDFLPIYRLKNTGGRATPDKGGVAVMCPGGLNGEGFDGMWQNFRGGAPIDCGIAGPRLGRHAAAALSAVFVSSFMTSPAVAVDGASRRIASDSAGGGTIFRASLLYVSSHGWLGGFARGDALSAYPAALPTAIAGVESPTKEFLPPAPYFLIGKLDAEGKRFEGPRWIVLAQCSTMNNTTWPAWARVMSRSTPQVRGILGYEEASPAAEASVSIADAFFRNLAAKMTFYDAWKAANHGQNWAAIVHDDATGDTLHGWGAAPPLRGSEISKYRGSASKAPAQQVAIAEAARPFVVRIFREDAAAGEITAATLDSGAAWLQPGGRFTLDVTAPHDFKRVDIQWVHIRPTFRQFDVNAVFARVEAPGAAEPVIPAAKKLQSVVYDVPRKHVRVTFVARDADGLEASGLEEHHSYLWPSVRLDDGAERVDARERGLLYYGVPQTRDL